MEAMIHLIIDDKHDDLPINNLPTPLKNMKVSWDDSSQLNGKSNMFQTTNQYIYTHPLVI
jgi:hypothetical protein